MDAEKIKRIVPVLVTVFIKKHKTTTIAISNIILLVFLTVLFATAKITAEEYAIVLAAGTSAITSILGYFTADEK